MLGRAQPGRDKKISSSNQLIVVMHHQLRIDLAYEFEHHADDDDHTGAGDEAWHGAYRGAGENNFHEDGRKGDERKKHATKKIKTI